MTLLESMGFCLEEDAVSELFFILLEIYVDYYNLNSKPDIFFICSCYISDVSDEEVLQLSDYMRKFFNKLTERDGITQILDIKLTYSCLTIIARVE